MYCVYIFVRENKTNAKKKKYFCIKYTVWIGYKGVVKQRTLLVIQYSAWELNSWKHHKSGQVLSLPWVSRTAARREVILRLGSETNTSNVSGNQRQRCEFENCKTWLTPNLSWGYNLWSLQWFRRKWCWTHKHNVSLGIWEDLQTVSAWMAD